MIEISHYGNQYFEGTSYKWLGFEVQVEHDKVGKWYPSFLLQVGGDYIFLLNVQLMCRSFSFTFWELYFR